MTWKICRDQSARFCSKVNMTCSQALLFGSLAKYCLLCYMYHLTWKRTWNKRNCRNFGFKTARYTNWDVLEIIIYQRKKSYFSSSILCYTSTEEKDYWGRYSILWIVTVTCCLIPNYTSFSGGTLGGCQRKSKAFYSQISLRRTPSGPASAVRLREMSGL